MADDTTTERNTLLDKAFYRAVSDALERAGNEPWSAEAVWIRAFREWALHHGADDPTGALLWADLHIATILYAVNNFDAERARRQEAEAKLLVYETDSNAVYMAGKSFMRGQLEPQLDALRDQLAAAERDRNTERRLAREWQQRAERAEAAHHDVQQASLHWQNLANERVAQLRELRAALAKAREALRGLWNIVVHPDEPDCTWQGRSVPWWCDEAEKALADTAEPEPKP